MPSTAGEAVSLLSAFSYASTVPRQAAGGGAMAGVTVAKALGSSTRADIFGHLRQAGAALTVRDVAGTFDLHPNVARTHLETLADAGLVVVGRRKNPAGGRPAKVYLARDEVGDDLEAGGRGFDTRAAASALLVRLLVGLLGEPGGGGRSLPSRAFEAAAAEGRRLVAGLNVRGDSLPLETVAQASVRALHPHAPEARVVKAGTDWVDVAGIRGLFRSWHDVRSDLADALERGLLSGAFAGAGCPVTLTEAGAAPGGEQLWRARAAAPASARTTIAPAGAIDARGQQRETGVVRAMRAVTGLRNGEVLEVLTDGPGSPAAFARWADRAGHELLGVERAVDATGRPGIRLLIRKGV